MLRLPVLRRQVPDAFMPFYGQIKEDNDRAGRFAKKARRLEKADVLRVACCQSNPQSSSHQKITKRTQRAGLWLGGNKRVYRQPGCSGYWMHDQIYIKIGILARR